MGIVDLVSSKKGRLYLRFFIAVAILAAAIHAYSALAANPFASPAIVTDANYTNANVSSAFVSNVIFGVANFTSENGTAESNSTFKWLKRTLYQPQNLSLVGYWKLDGNANDAFSYLNKNL